MAMTEIERLRKELADAKAETEAAKAALAAVPTRKLGLKVSAKGCVTLTGMRLPYGISFYAEEWQRIFTMKDDIEAFIAANKSSLSFKD